MNTLKKIIFFIFCLFSLTSNAQVFGGKVAFGTMTYQGDMSGTLWERDVYKSLIQIGLNYELYPRLDIELSAIQGSIIGSDKYSPFRKRGLSFKSDIDQISLSGKYYWTKMSEYDSKLGLYSGLGFGVVAFNPKSFNGFTFEDLQPLMLEGVDYELTAFEITSFLGMSYQINPTFVFNSQINYHQPFTDYLDDVSKRGGAASFDFYYSVTYGIIYRFGNESDINHHGKSGGPKMFQ